jgi:hypothetical protein
MIFGPKKITKNKKNSWCGVMMTTSRDPEDHVICMFAGLLANHDRAHSPKKLSNFCYRGFCSSGHCDLFENNFSFLFFLFQLSPLWNIFQLRPFNGSIASIAYASTVSEDWFSPGRSPPIKKQVDCITGLSFFLDVQK